MIITKELNKTYPNLCNQNCARWRSTVKYTVRFSVGIMMTWPPCQDHSKCGISIVKIILWRDSLIFIMKVPILVSRHLYIENPVVRISCTVYPKKYAHVFALLCFVVVIHWLIFPYPSGLLHWHCGNLTTAPLPAKQTWWIWINTSCEFIMNDCITTTKQITTKPCAYFLGYSVCMAHKRRRTILTLPIFNMF